MIHLDYRDNRPIYEQVKDGLRRQIVSGILSPEEKLPSVRSLAAELAINPNTIQRAYVELEREGFIYSISGRGSFVAPGNTQNDGRKTMLKEKIKPVLEELRSLGMSEEELLQLWRGDNV